MRREEAQTVDRLSETSEDPQAKSFVVGTGHKIANLVLPDVRIAGKDDYKKQPYCVICFRNFTNFFRQHHCRVCANAVCKDCSKSSVNKERACDLCIMELSNPAESKKKKQILQTLQTLCAYLIYRRNTKMNELEALKTGGQGQEFMGEINQQERQIIHLENENKGLREDKQILEAELEKIREANAQIEETIAQLEREGGRDGIEQFL